MMDQKPIDRFDLKELSNLTREPLEESSNPIENVPKIITSSLLDTRKSRSSGRIVKAPNRFTFLGEAISDEFDLDPSSYNEAISDKDSGNWQSIMKVEDDVYMIEPYDFIAKGQEHMVCKFHRFFIGFKQVF